MIESKQLSARNEKAGMQLLMKLGRIATGRQLIMQKLMKDPAREVDHYLPYIQSPKGKRIINLLGSKGNKAVALAL